LWKKKEKSVDTAGKAGAVVGVERRRGMERGKE
jgi:hypothetical protein